MDGSARTALLFLALTAAPFAAAGADGIAGSPSSMVHQHQIAVNEAYSFLRTPTDVQKLAATGALVPVTDGPNVTLSKVSYPFARPEVRDFVERFAASFRAATNAPLVVTSLTRPESKQPSNAHRLSVHPAGMAVDLRVPADPAARAFLETSLLAMERAGVLDVTREHTPAHYHVAVFAGAYGPWAARQDSLAARARVVADSVARVVAASLARGVPSAPPDANWAVPVLFALAALAALAGPVAFAGRRHRMAGR